jgi:hypothetical protein
LPEVRCRLFYSQPLDRLIGGDYFQEFHGRQTRSSLSSISRAKALKDAVDALAKAYRQRFPESDSGALPFTQILAVLALDAFPVEVDGEQQMISIDSLFTLRQLSAAPEDFKEFAQIISIPPGIETLKDRMPATPEQCFALVTQLFRIAGCGHRLPAAFSRAHGCNLLPDSVTPLGELTDLYYFHLPEPEDSPDEFRLRQRNDLLSALSTLSEVAGGVSLQIEDLMACAFEAYTGQTNRNLSRFLPLTAGSAADLADCLVDTLQPDWK